MGANSTMSDIFARGAALGIHTFPPNRPPKYWQKRSCGKCQEALRSLYDYPRVDTNYLKNLTVFHDYCRKCRAKIRASWECHPLYSPEMEKFWHKYMPGLRSGAYGRSLLVAIDAEDIIDRYISQEGICAVSGLEMNWMAKGKPGRANRAYLRPSVDRIDSHGNYTNNNIQIVAQVVNLMKGALPQSRFIEICGAIARHNLSL